jgi:hypothetical protein
MKETFLKISSVLLCGLLIYNSLGYFVVLSVMRMAVRHQKWAELSSIPENQLSTFIFNKNEKNSRLKIENSREILIDGKLFDVVRITDNGKQLKYSCIYDQKEESLISKTRLFNSKTQQMPVQNTTKHILDKIIKTGIFTNESTLISGNYNSLYSNYPKPIYSGPAIQISLPPPQPSC